MIRGTAGLIDNLRHLERIFDLDKNGLAEALMAIVVDDIERHMDREEDPDGNAWPALSDAYADYKAKVAPGDPMAVLHGVMKTRENLEGLRRIARDRATMVFGTSEEAQREAEWFQEGNDRQPARRFYFIGDDAINELDAYCRAHLDTAIQFYS